MTSQQLFEAIEPNKTEKFGAQLNNARLSFWRPGIFNPLIKDAARCTSFQSDVYYDLKEIEDRVNNFNPRNKFEPIWIGFRRHGVDHTEYVLHKCGDDDHVSSVLHREYFALYSVTVEPDEEYEGFYNVYLNEYYM